jgi:hypothetical protein
MQSLDAVVAEGRGFSFGYRERRTDDRGRAVQEVGGILSLGIETE